MLFVFFAVPASKIDKTASVTSSTPTAFMQRKSIGHLRKKQGLHSTWCRTIMCRSPSGPVRRGSVEPKIATVGTPSKEARCMVPVSFVSNKQHFRNSSISCSSVVWPMRFTHESPSVLPIVSPTVMSFGVPKRIHCTDDFEEPAAATSANRSGNYRFADPYSAPGERAIFTRAFAGGRISVPSEV